MRVSFAALLSLLPLLAATFSYASLTTLNDKIMYNGSPINLKGANYFGWQQAEAFFMGFYSKPDGMRQDFATVMYRWQLLGFNTIRVPFSFEVLDSIPPNSKLKTGCKLPSFVSKTPIRSTRLISNIIPCPHSPKSHTAWWILLRQSLQASLPSLFLPAGLTMAPTPPATATFPKTPPLADSSGWSPIWLETTSLLSSTITPRMLL